MNTIKKLFAWSTVITMLFVTSCVDKDFDEPPVSGIDPALTVTHTIKQLKALYTVGGNPVALPASAVIAGIVISDDTQGNFYKDLIIEDSTAGLLIRIDKSNLATVYPVGRRVFVKCGGLYMGEYNGLIQIGFLDGTSIGRIPSTLVDNYIVRGMWNQPYNTKVTQDFNTLNTTNDQNMLVRLDSVHFLASEVCNTWADLALQQSANRTLIDKNGNQIFVRTSNFSTFAGGFIPGGTGSVTGVLQIFGSDFQLILRDLNDVSGFPPSNCVVNTTPVHNITDLRASYTGAIGTIPAGSDIEGIVITDKNAGNITGNNMVIQDAGAGITVRFTTPNTFSLGDKVHIDISGQELSEFNGLLQVNNVDITKATLTGTGTITPRIATVADIMTNGEAWESTLVTISGVTITGGTAGTYSGTTNLDDGTGVLPMFTRSAATFASTLYPTTTVSVTGIVSDFNGRQLNIRNTTDVQ